MNLDTLIEILNDYREEFGGDAEVRLMTQQNWPFENRICGVTSGRDMNEADDEGDDAIRDADGATAEREPYVGHDRRRAEPQKLSQRDSADPWPQPRRRHHRGGVRDCGSGLVGRDHHGLRPTRGASRER